MSCCLPALKKLSMRERVNEREDAKLPRFSPEDELPKGPDRSWDKHRLEAVESFARQAECYFNFAVPNPKPKDVADVKTSKKLIDEAVSVYSAAMDERVEVCPKLRADVETRTKTWEAFESTRRTLRSDKRSQNHQLQRLAERMVEQWGIFGRVCEYMATDKPLSESNKKGIERRKINQMLDSIRDMKTRLAMRTAYATQCDRERMAELERHRVEQQKESKRKQAEIAEQMADAAAEITPPVEGEKPCAHLSKKPKTAFRSSVDVVLSTQKGPTGYGEIDAHPDRAHLIVEIEQLLEAEFPVNRTHPTDVLHTIALELRWAPTKEMRPDTLALLRKAEQMHNANSSKTDSGLKTTMKASFFKVNMPPEAGPSDAANDGGVTGGLLSSLGDARHNQDASPNHAAANGKAVVG